MDVAKYIGLFLMKNQSCFIQGLGNLELKRIPAYYDGQNLHAPTTEVTLTTAGSIDDSLANFIATSEMISISKALNALRDFSIQSKADIQAGKDILIPFIGRFTDNDGKILFVTDAKLQYAPAPIPAVRMAKRVEEIPVPRYEQQEQQPSRRKQKQPYTPPPPLPPVYDTQEPYEEEEEERSINWGRVIFFISILFVIGIGAMYLYEIYKERVAMRARPVLQQQPITAPDTTHIQPAVVPPHDTTKVDSTPHDTTTTTVAGPDILENGSVAAPTASNKPKPTGKLYQYDVVLKRFYTSEKAEKEVANMKQRGIGVRMVMVDSLNYLMVLHVRSAKSDGEKVIDSMNKLYPGAYLR